MIAQIYDSISWTRNWSSLCIENLRGSLLYLKCLLSRSFRPLYAWDFIRKYQCVTQFQFYLFFLHFISIKNSLQSRSEERTERRTDEKENERVVMWNTADTAGDRFIAIKETDLAGLMVTVLHVLGRMAHYPNRYILPSPRLKTYNNQRELLNVLWNIWKSLWRMNMYMYWKWWYSIAVESTPTHQVTHTE